ncbi:tol-pal system YbgF family protein [Lacinutrix iliipiscaria]|uniref:Tol-pal system YbgF family protein n=1 Tax=Lacinutrix iliipiscaria TaxID=1230532 RepID=A0ABW5WRQ5_9FLAO
MDKEQLITNYFSNGLSEEEKVLFNRLIETDSDFATKVDFETRVKHAIHKKEHQKLKQHFKNLDHSIKNVDKTPRRKIWLVAASIALFTTLAVLYNYVNSDYSSDDLFASYYQPAKNIVQPIVRDGNSKTDKVDAFIAYQKEDYATAKTLFRNLYVSTKDSEFLFYEGISLLELQETDDAILKLTAHLESKDAVSEMTPWYLALAYLKKGDVRNAKTLLINIVEDQSRIFKKEDAKALLKKL